MSPQDSINPWDIQTLRLNFMAWWSFEENLEPYGSISIHNIQVNHIH